MKTLLVGLVMICTIVLAGCAGEVVATRPSEVVYDRPAAPGPDYIWISGDWVWAGGRYSWHEGHWDRRREGHVWHDGGWESRRGGWAWHRGYWK